MRKGAIVLECDNVQLQNGHCLKLGSPVVKAQYGGRSKAGKCRKPIKITVMAAECSPFWDDIRIMWGKSCTLGLSSTVFSTGHIEILWFLVTDSGPHVFLTVVLKY